MNYDIILSLEAVEDVLRIIIASRSKAAIVKASEQIEQALANDPADAGKHLSEGLYFIDREPLRGFYTIDVSDMTVEIVNVKSV